MPPSTERRAAPDLTPRTLEERTHWWQAHLDPRYPVLVAEEGGAVQRLRGAVAWVSGEVYAHTAEAGLYLAPAAQGQGLGTRLMRALLDEAARRGHHVIIARVWAEQREPAWPCAGAAVLRPSGCSVRSGVGTAFGRTACCCNASSRRK